MRVMNFTGKPLVMIRLEAVLERGSNVLSAEDVDVLFPDGYLNLKNASVIEFGDNPIIMYDTLLLPKRKRDTLYVVDEKVCKVINSVRRDFMYPSGEVFNQDGKVIGYSGLSLYSDEADGCF